MTITLLALLLGAMATLPTPLIVVLTRLGSQAIFLAVLLGVVHGQGRLRTFCTGGLVGAAYHLLPELLAPSRGADLVFGDLAKSLLAEHTGTFVSSPVRAVLGAVGGIVELVTSVVTLGLFSVGVRRWIERRR